MALGGDWDLISSEERIEAVAAVLRRAYEQHQALRRSAVMATEPSLLSFDGDPLCVVEYRRYHVMSNNYDVLARRQTYADAAHPE